MNGAGAAALPAISGGGGSSTLEAPPVYLGRLLGGLILAVAAADSCFWGISGLGFSVAVFFPILAGVILWNRKTRTRKRTTRVILGLMVGAAMASVLEVGFCNSVIWLALILALAGDTFFEQVDSPWGRWLSQAVAMTWAPGRVFWLWFQLARAGWTSGVGWAGRVGGGFFIALPAVVLLLVFGGLLSSGNAVFGAWTDNLFEALWNFVSRLFDFGRMVLWCFTVFFVLPLLCPARVSAWWWQWTHHLPRVPAIFPARAAFWSSALMLGVLNLLFLVANAADALFLWSGLALPAGVTYSGYVHHGVDTLTVTVVLSAVVLTAIFQQATEITGGRALRVLGCAWIVQNVFLLASVAERLARYIGAYGMTVARLGVIIFLVIVALGFVLLAVKILREKSLSWLIGGCVLVVLGAFYVTQFLNLAGWSADDNAARWEKDHTRQVDVCYLHRLGAAAWPALWHLRDQGYPGLDDTWKEIEESDAWKNAGGFHAQNWREFSLLAWWNRATLEIAPK